MFLYFGYVTLKLGTKFCDTSSTFNLTLKNHINKNKLQNNLRSQ